MNLNDKVQYMVMKPTTQVCTVWDLLKKVVEMRHHTNEEFDFYIGESRGMLERVFTLDGFTLGDNDLFRSSRRLFWEKYMDRVTEDMLSTLGATGGVFD